jgi:hypothetical protein
MNPDAGSNAAGNERAFRAISYALVFLMILCLIMAISSLLSNIMPSWHTGIIAGVMLLIVIDRLFTHQRLKTLTPFSGEWVFALGARWIVFGVVIRLLLSYANGFQAFVAEMSLFAQGYIESFLSPEFVVTLLLALLAWYLTAQFLELLDEIGLNQALALGAEPSFIQYDATAAHRRLVGLIFTLGIVLVILTALGRINFSAFFSNSGGSTLVERFSPVEGGVLLYFIFGLALLAQGRLMSLQTRWNVQRIPISSDNLARQWGLYSLIFLVLIVLTVSLLPTGDSLGIFSVLGTLLNFLWNILFFLWRLIVALAFLLLSLPFLLIGKAPPVDQMPVLPDLPAEGLPPPLPTAESSAIWILVRSILLWGALLLIIGFSLRNFLKQHDTLLAALRKAPVIGWLLFAWEWLRRNADRTRVSLSRALEDGWQSMVARLQRRRSLPPLSWISLRALDPRRKIYFFYLAMIRRGDERDLRRKPSQTPSEYAVTLEKSVPSAAEDIDSITEAFVEARYSRREVNAGQADTVKATWGRIRRALQEKSK